MIANDRAQILLAMICLTRKFCVRLDTQSRLIADLFSLLLATYVASANEDSYPQYAFTGLTGMLTERMMSLATAMPAERFLGAAGLFAGFAVMGTLFFLANVRRPPGSYVMRKSHTYHRITFHMCGT